jgi:hypothetical protein
LAGKGDKNNDRFLEQVVALDAAKEDQRNTTLKKYIERREQGLVERLRKDAKVKQALKSEFIQVVSQ